MKYQWKDIRVDNQYYYDTNTGMVVGQVHNITHTAVWVAKVWVSPMVEKNLGQYISLEFSKKAVEAYWLEDSMTLLEVAASQNKNYSY